MKIIVLVPTGERRSVKQDEWYITDSGHTFQWNDRTGSFAEHDVITKHEIQVAEGTHHVAIDLLDKQGGPTGHLTRILLPRPEKRYRWQGRTRDGLTVNTVDRHTRSEIEHIVSDNLSTWMPIPGTEE